eukprot:gene3078-3909_t
MDQHGNSGCVEAESPKTRASVARAEKLGAESVELAPESDSTRASASPGEISPLAWQLVDQGMVRGNLQKLREAWEACFHEHLPFPLAHRVDGLELDAGEVTTECQDAGSGSDLDEDEDGALALEGFTQMLTLTPGSGQQVTSVFTLTPGSGHQVTEPVFTLTPGSGQQVTEPVFRLQVTEPVFRLNPGSGHQVTEPVFRLTPGSGQQVTEPVFRLTPGSGQQITTLVFTLTPGDGPQATSFELGVISELEHHAAAVSFADQASPHTGDLLSRQSGDDVEGDSGKDSSLSDIMRTVQQLRLERVASKACEANPGGLQCRPHPLTMEPSAWRRSSGAPPASRLVFCVSRQPGSGAGGDESNRPSSEEETQPIQVSMADVAKAVQCLTKPVASVRAGRLLACYGRNPGRLQGPVTLCADEQSRHVGGRLVLSVLPDSSLRLLWQSPKAKPPGEAVIAHVSAERAAQYRRSAGPCADDADTPSEGSSTAWEPPAAVHRIAEDPSGKSFYVIAGQGAGRRRSYFYLQEPSSEDGVAKLAALAEVLDKMPSLSTLAGLTEAKLEQLEAAAPSLAALSNPLQGSLAQTLQALQQATAGILLDAALSGEKAAARVAQLPGA